MDEGTMVAVAGVALGVWLMVLFGCAVFWAMRPKNKKRFEEDGMIPFREDMDGGL